MIYAHSIPENIVWTVAGSDTSPEFATDVRLDNGQPGESTVITGVGTSSPSITHYIDLRASWSNAVPAWVFSLLDLVGVPSGVRIDCTGRRPADGGYTYDLGGSSIGQRTLALPDGRVRHIVIGSSSLDSLNGLQWRIYNDRDGVTWANAETEIQPGEARPWSASWFERARARRRRGRTGNRQVIHGYAGGVHVVSRLERRSLAVEIGGGQAAYYGSGMSSGLDYEKLEALADSASHRCLVIPRRYDSFGDFDAELVHRSALFGIASFGDIQHPSATTCSGSIQVEEVL